MRFCQFFDKKLRAHIQNPDTPQALLVRAANDWAARQGSPSKTGRGPICLQTKQPYFVLLGPLWVTVLEPCSQERTNEILCKPTNKQKPYFHHWTMVALHSRLLTSVQTHEHFLKRFYAKHVRSFFHKATMIVFSKKSS